jgi:hypothetical protein
MFQYATLFAVGNKLNYSIGLPANNLNIKLDGTLDTSNNKWIPYKLDLFDCFDITCKLLNDEECAKIDKIYKEPHFQFDSKIFNISDNTNIDGYFQSDKYFSDIRLEILKEFKFKTEIENNVDNILRNIIDKEIVSIHIRRGDYINNPTLELLTIEYFIESVSYFNDKDYNFLIFSDDIDWCKDTFSGEQNIYFSEKNSQFVDLCLMSRCQHNIISNSTFSWWGAWLNTNPTKKIIAPSKWFKNPNTNTKDLIPENWIRI